MINLCWKRVNTLHSEKITRVTVEPSMIHLIEMTTLLPKHSQELLLSNRAGVGCGCLVNKSAHSGWQCKKP